MVWDRKQRWEAILLEKIAVIVQQRLNDPRLGFITITRTELSRDKRICHVFFTVLGTDSQRRRSERALADAAPRVLEILAPSLRMRSLPELRFTYDEAVKRESRVLDLISEVTEERKAREEATGVTSEGDAPGDDDPDAEGLDGGADDDTGPDGELADDGPAQRSPDGPAAQEP